jgi:putative tryptophan/tyrosine transport system substrate-binding protein
MTGDAASPLTVAAQVFCRGVAMSRWHAWYICLGVLLGWLALLSNTQAAVAEVPVLKSHDIEPFKQAIAGFVAACNLQITEYDVRGSASKQQSIIKRVVATKPKLILAIGAVAAQVAKEMVEDIPVVFFMVPNPQQYGLEGRNIAGVSLDIPAEVQFARYKMLVPTLHTLGVIYNPDKTGPLVNAAQAIAQQLDLQLLPTAVGSPKEVPAALRSMLGKIDALWMVPDETVVTPMSFEFLLLTAFEHHLPFLAASEIFVEVGAMAALSPDYAEVGRQVCQLTKEIESGHRSPMQVNIIPPAKVNLAINLKTASKLGLSLPSEVVQSASKVYR